MAEGFQMINLSYQNDIPDFPWVSGRISTPVGEIPRVPTELTWPDRLGSWKARWDINRMNYSIPPGLYCVGNANNNSPVLVTANYKMSFDRLRKELSGINAWILVLDTKGINVWCAAGKGTFGTAEVVRRIALVGLAQLVSHRTIILPQLGAPGVAAHQVKKQSGFKVVYGPVQASDIPDFLKAGMKAAPAMKIVRFNFLDRLILTPIELVGIKKPALIAAVLLLIMHYSGVVKLSWGDILLYVGAIFVGAVATPALLPWIPGRAFSWKGWLMGLLWSIFMICQMGEISHLSGILIAGSSLLVAPAIAAYLAMNFTGASTYTSLSGVQREMRIALPAIIVSSTIGIVLWLVGQFV